MCANEIEIGMIIPDPEIALFKHKLPANVFFETVQLARRWTGPDAKTAGIVSDTLKLNIYFLKQSRKQKHYLDLVLTEKSMVE